MKISERIGKRLERVGARLQNRYYNSSGLTTGGIYNSSSGLGTGLDKSESSFFQPTRYYWRPPLEILYVQSSAAKKFINLPVDDMFIRWRTWTSDSESDNDLMEEAEKKHDITTKLRTAMRAGRAYGTAAMVLMTKEAPMDMPLEMERLREGDLKAIRVLDRYDMTVIERDYDLFSPDYVNPVYYYLHPIGSYGTTMKVHHSRVLRFDGIKPLGDSRFTAYDQDWGVSELVPVILSIIEDQSLASAIAHMSQEASIPVLSVTELRDIIAGRAGGEASVEEIGEAINKVKSVFRLMMVDKNREEFSRVGITFGGLADLMTKYAERLAMSADIPMTRWAGRSPAGMNATGDSDMKNYVIMAEANRENMLTDPLVVLDEVLARDAGMQEAPEYEWNSLLEIDEKEQAEISKMKAEAVKIAVDTSLIDEDEGREALNGDPIFGELTGPAPEPDLEMLPGMPGDPFGGPPKPGAKPPAGKPPVGKPAPKSAGGEEK